MHRTATSSELVDAHADLSAILGAAAITIGT
jgi:hypothetical protein